MSDQQINSSSAASRYGIAIFELASENKTLSRVEKELTALRVMIDGSGDLAACLASPLIGGAQKNAVLQALAKQAKFSPLVCDFIGVICQNGRADALCAIVAALSQRIEAAAGTLRATAKTAQALSAKQKSSLEAGLKKALDAKIKLDTQIEPKLLGGLIVQVGSVMFDSSLRTQLEGLKLAMKES